MSGGERRNADAALVAALAAGRTVQDAARDAGVSVATAHRRLAEEDFCRRVAEARDELVSRAVGRLSEASTKAVETLEALLGEQTPPAVRLGAAKAILDMTLRGREAADLVAEVRREIERRQSQP